MLATYIAQQSAAFITRYMSSLVVSTTVQFYYKISFATWSSAIISESIDSLARADREFHFHKHQTFAPGTISLLLNMVSFYNTIAVKLSKLFLG